MRITNKMMTTNMMSNINRNKQNMSTRGDQYSTGQKIQRPSEDPIVAVRDLKYDTNLTELNQYYEKNIPDAKSWMDISESALDNINKMLTSMHTYCDQGANDTLTVSDRDAIVETLTQYREQIYQLGNSDYAGRYVFTGFRTDTSLIFQEEAPDLEYMITEPLRVEDLQQIPYVLGEIKYEEGKTSAEYLSENTALEYAYRFRLSYDSLNKDQEVTIKYRTADMTEEDEDLEMTFSTFAGDDASKKYEVEGDGHFLPETGEIILSGEQYDILRNATSISATYDKVGFSKGELRPEHYFDCTRYELEIDEEGNATRKETEDGAYMSTDYSNPLSQVIQYEINFSQKLQVNTLAKDAVSSTIGREIDEILSTVDQVVAIESKMADVEKKLNDQTIDEETRTALTSLKGQMDNEYALWQKVLQEKFSTALTTTTNVQSQVNIALADLGSRYKRLELTEQRLSSQQVDFEEMINDNSSVEMEEAIINYSQAQVTYNASLQAASKVVKNTLLDFL